jgi:mRNA interferase MazF
MNVKRGDIVLDFPYSDQTGSKVRPALVVQSDVWNQRLDDTVLALITSSRQRRTGANTQVFVDITTVEGRQSRLRIDSIIQCENLITYDRGLLLRILGNLPATTMSLVDDCLKAALGLS